MDLERLYWQLPISFQHIACSIEGLRIQLWRFGGNFSRLLREAEERDTWGEEQLLEYRDGQLRTFLAHCAQAVPFYQKLFAERGIIAGKIRSLDHLKMLPILNKDVVRANLDKLASSAVPARQRVTVHTSGTTGGGLRFASTTEAIRKQWAVWWRFYRWHGIQPGTWCAYFGGRSVVPPQQSVAPFWRINYPRRQILFSGYHMTEANLKSYAEEIRRRQPPWLNGYPSLLSLLAVWIQDTKFDLGYQPRWITLGAENVMSQQAGAIQKAFGVRPVQNYGMAEAVANICECEKGSLHVCEDFSAVEFVPDTVGWRIVGTNFTNPATPLVRYDVGDLVLPRQGSCECGRPGRLVERIDGREEDYIVLPNGAFLGRMDHIFKDMTKIREAQIRQKDRNEIVLRIVPTRDFSVSDEKALVDETRKRVGSEIAIKVELVDKIQRTGAGKLRFVVSELAEGKLDAPFDRTSVGR